MPDIDVGTVVWTYCRRRSDKPLPTQGLVAGVINLPGFYPSKKYLISLGGILSIRDDYTCHPENISKVPVVVNTLRTKPLDMTYDD